MAQVVVQFVNVVPNAEREIGLTKSSFTSAGGMLRATIYIAEKPQAVISWEKTLFIR